MEMAFQTKADCEQQLKARAQFFSRKGPHPTHFLACLLPAMSTPLQESDTPKTPSYFTVAEVADLLRLSAKSIYRLAQENPDMPMLKLGGTVRFPRERTSNPRPSPPHFCSSEQQQPARGWRSGAGASLVLTRMPSKHIGPRLSPTMPHKH
jgi:excisionase family DNA binding protein